MSPARRAPPALARSLAALALGAILPAAPALAQGGSVGGGPVGERPVQGVPSRGALLPAPLGQPLPVSVGGRAPWQPAWAYDSGGDNDRRPELPYFQQGRGQQTGGPARNLLPDDGLHLFPR